MCLEPTGNRQGTFKFLDLETLEVTEQKEFKEYTMPALTRKEIKAKG